MAEDGIVEPERAAHPQRRATARVYDAVARRFALPVRAGLAEHGLELRPHGFPADARLARYVLDAVSEGRVSPRRNGSLKREIMPKFHASSPTRMSRRRPVGDMVGRFGLDTYAELKCRKDRRGPTASSALRRAFVALLAIGMCPAAAIAEQPSPSRNASPGIEAQPLRSVDASGFEWLDVTRSFPDWADDSVFIYTIFEGDHGGLVARVAVSREGDKTPILTTWDVDLLTGTRSLAVPAGGSKGRYLPPKGDHFNETIGSLAVNISPSDRMVVTARDIRGWCRDPINDYYTLLHSEGNAGADSFDGTRTTIKSLVFIVPAHSNSGNDIGGECGANDVVSIKKIHHFASSSGYGLFPLRDKTSIVQVGLGPANGPTFWLRLKRDLSIGPKPPRMLVMDESDYEALLEKKGIYRTQSHLLSLLHR